MNKLRILLVDADPDRLELFSSRLQEAEHHVLPVTSLEEAEEALFVLKVDVVIFGSSFPDNETEILVERLRGIENTQKNAVRAPIFALLPEVLNAAGWMPGNGGIIDGYLSEAFNSQLLLAAMEGISQGSAAVAASPEETGLMDLPRFEPEKFRQQVAYDPELTAEIIDLFLEEKRVEIPEMQESFQTGDFGRLSELAHTIKGSLSSLHAAMARHYAQELESAAKKREESNCQRLIQELTRELDALQPLLLQLRQQVKPQ